MLSIILVLALVLDMRFGEPRRFHPVVGFGRLANQLETTCYADSMLRGIACVASIIVCAALILLLFQFGANGLWQFWNSTDAEVYRQIAYTLLSALLLYLCIAWRSLIEHADAVSLALQGGNLNQARALAARILSRDTDTMNQQELASATIESVLENGNDAIFAGLFWFCIAGLPGIIVYRMVNTLDAMWGYKNARYKNFGWAAARSDDLMNYIPARLTALSYALAGNFNNAWHCWMRQARDWKSPNAGPVMASGAGSLTLHLGGGAWYHGEFQQRPALGAGSCATTPDIQRALRLVKRAIVIWIALIAIGELIVSLYD